MHILWFYQVDNGVSFCRADVYSPAELAEIKSEPQFVAETKDLRTPPVEALKARVDPKDHKNLETYLAWVVEHADEIENDPDNPL